VTESVGPGGKWQSRRVGLFLFRIVVAEKAGTSLGVLMLRFGIRRAAMFAKPAITEIEEMVCLNHGRIVASDR